MNCLKRVCLVSLLVLGCVIVNGQSSPKIGGAVGHSLESTESRTESQPNRGLPEKEEFDQYVGMMKGYYDALESRVEKTIALFLVVVGWLVTSETARRSLAKERLLFWGALAIVTLLVIFRWLNLSHFIDQSRRIEAGIRELKSFAPEYYVRYVMPDGILWVYLTPILIFYAFILLALLQIRCNFNSSSDSIPKTKEEAPR